MKTIKIIGTLLIALGLFALSPLSELLPVDWLPTLLQLLNVENAYIKIVPTEEPNNYSSYIVVAVGLSLLAVPAVWKKFKRN